MVVAHELGLGERIELVTTQPRENPDQITPHNGLGKIPVLITDEGQVIYDSPVICEYLNAEFGGHRLLPATGSARWHMLTQVAAADGVIDAAILVRNERLRSADRQSADWMEWQLRKVRQTLDKLEEQADAIAADPNLGTIAIGCMLGYVPRRLEEYEGLKEFPRLAELSASLSRRPSFAQDGAAIDHDCALRKVPACRGRVYPGGCRRYAQRIDAEASQWRLGST